MAWGRRAPFALACCCLFGFIHVGGVSLLRCPDCRSTRQDDDSCPVLLDTSVPVPSTAKVEHLVEAPPAFNAPPHTDDYFWLRDDDRNNSAVLSHLQEENAYAESVLAPSLPLQQRLLAEMLGRIPKEESSVPQRLGGHWYYSVHSSGMQYRRLCRRPLDDPAAPPSEHDSMNLTQPEQVLLDQDEMAGSHAYFDMAGPAVSQDEQLIAYGVDTSGSEMYTLFVRNLTSNQTVLEGSDVDAYVPLFRQCAGHFVFLDDNRTLLFTTLTQGTRRADKVWLFDLTSEPAEQRRTASHARHVQYTPHLLYHEPDEAFHLSIWRSRSDAVVYLRGGSDSTHHLLYLPTNSSGPNINFTTLAPKVPEHEYVVRDSPSGPNGGSHLYAVLYSPEQRNGQLVVADLAPNALLNSTASDGGRRRASSGSSSEEEHGSEEGGSTDNSSGSSSSSQFDSGDVYPGSHNSSSGGGDASPEEGSDSSSERTASAASASSTAAEGGVSGDRWTVLQAHSREVEIVDITVSSEHLAVLERRNGTLIATAYQLPSDGTPLKALRDGRQIVFEAPSYSLEFGDQGPFASHLLRVRYSSLVQPASTYDINMATGNRVLKQQQEVVGFDGSQYHTRLLWASSSEGAQVPISLAYRGELVRLDGSDPLLLEAYGAYGATFDPEFSGSQLSLLDRGFICAIAHVRGGGDLGRYWYQDGKMLAKNHTFDDLAAAADYLIKAKYTSADRLALWGRSAGGLTVGATLNRRPELFKAAILDVPFVDVVSTMSDPSLPLTVPEWEEWGDPLNDPAAYDNMLSYSPLDNVAAQPYPHLLLTGGLNDPRVSYWEPAKMAAKVRELKTSSNSLVLLKTNMAAGHFASSGLEGQLQERAFKFAFLLQTLAPCAVLANDHTDLGDRCPGCFAALVAAATTVALVTLVVVLRPSSRIARKWRRLGGWEQAGRRGGEDEDEDAESEEGYDTRLYSVHMGSSQAAEVAEGEAARQRQIRQQQLEEQGLSLTSYEAVRETVRDRLVPIPPPSSATLPAAPPKRRITLGGAASGTLTGAASEPAGNGSSVELSRLKGSSGGSHRPANEASRTSPDSIRSS